MAQQELEPPEIHRRFESVCGEGMAQQMWGHELREVRGLPGASAHQRHGLGGHRARAGLAGKEPGLRLVLVPILP